MQIGDRTIPEDLAARLRCPRCGAGVTGDASGIECERDHRFPLRDGFVDCTPAALEPVVEKVAETFGFQWNEFGETQAGDERDWHHYFADVDVDGIVDAVALDAGCGMGRYTRVTAEHVRSLAALDISEAVRAAAANTASQPNVVVLRGDLRTPPFAPRSFDLVTSLGVVHYMPEPREGILALADLVAPGGQLLVYVYSKPRARSVRAVGLGAAALLRKITPKVPKPAMKALSWPLAALQWALVVRPGRWFPGLPLAYYRDRPFRDLWLDTNDRLSPVIEHRFVWDDLRPWYAEAGLEVVTVREDAGLFVLARRGL